MGPTDIVINGLKSQQDEYLRMFKSTTGNKYSLDKSIKPKNDEAPANCNGYKSAELASIIDKGISSTNKYEI